MSHVWDKLLLTDIRPEVRPDENLRLEVKLLMIKRKILVALQ